MLLQRLRGKRTHSTPKATIRNQMPASSKAKSLSSLVRSAIKSKASSISLASPADDATLKYFASSLDSSPPSKPKSKKSIKSNKPLSEPTDPSVVTSLNLDPAWASDLTNEVPGEIFSILSGGSSSNSPDLQGTEDEKSMEKALELPWFPDMSHSVLSMRRKEITRERKQKWIFKSSQVNRFGRLVNMCADRLGTHTTIQVFDKLGRESGVKEYNALIKICIERARSTADEDVGLEQIHMAFQIFISMKEQGFPLEEETYGQFLAYLVDMGMTEEFQFFCGVIKAENPSSVARLGYYEMLLWIRVDDEEKIQELCNYIISDDGGTMSILQENYLLALCESDRKEEILQLLEIMDITQFSSLDCVASIFRCLGRLLLESYAEKLLLSFKACDRAAENITNFISSYVVGIPNLAVEDVISNFKNWHTKLEVTPSSAGYEKLIMYCCESLKVHAALEMVEEMCELGLTVSIGALHSILRASDESCDFNLVRQMYSMICQYKLKANGETFRSMISLCVKMKDYGGAYDMLSDLEKMNLTPTASMYNAIMVGFFREKNIYGGLRVLKQMKEADVQPDSQTFSYLISNCESEEDINKYYEELKHSGIQVTKQIFMALVNAYATCGQFEKAKQVLLDKGIPVKCLNEIKSMLVQSLASHGQLCDAFSIYEEMKQAGCSLEPKAVISLIEHLQSDEELSRLLPLLDELDDPDYWFEGCLRTILHCVRYKHLRPALNLLKQLRDKFCTDELALEVIFNQVFALIAESESTHLQLGLDLLHAIKNELGLTPSRKCLDFLLNACANAKDLRNSLLIWKEYETAGLPYNTLSFIRMYQALLAAGDRKASKILLSKIPKDDPHVRTIIKACKTIYS
ncbi:pentatricopeptide repeat-containing protein At4g04790, mitochondrial-like isoform X3 [Prunus avium]|uniref:Pentatricopeptide repeat-containing protein At4g04790, mitochondrial-like isoform X3 n=1 Tax=Prunus avium TaxID=42229 RepID=A0A6P5U5D4_PRUAV|nr:pentatricopeptide repeat-containing protein At4g04790, mitochondrial-like isoform X3 [Prunus avium]